MAILYQVIHRFYRVFWVMRQGRNGQNLALCIAVSELMHEEKKTIVTGVSSPNASAGDACPEVVLGGQ